MKYEIHARSNGGYGSCLVGNLDPDKLDELEGEAYGLTGFEWYIQPQEKEEDSE